jgi:hypothetical protein
LPPALAAGCPANEPEPAAPEPLSPAAPDAAGTFEMPLSLLPHALAAPTQKQSDRAECQASVLGFFIRHSVVTDRARRQASKRHCPEISCKINGWGALRFVRTQL